MLYLLKNYKTHIIAWLSFIIYECTILGFYSGKFAGFWDYAIHYAVNIGLFYLHAHFVLPKATVPKQNTFWKVPLFITLEVVTYFIVMLTVDALIDLNPKLLEIERSLTDRQVYLGTIFRATYFIAFSTGYYFLRQFILASKRANKLESERLNNIIEIQRIEHDLLKSQINPHFLFNTLNFIHNNTRKISPSTAQAITILSDMMRYSASIKEEFILLIEQIDNIIRLHHIKKGSNLNIEFHYSNEITSLRFVPFVVITLVENIFKHGNLSPEAPKASINMRIENEMFILETSNSTNQNRNNTGLNSGLSNINKRLLYAYGNEVLFHHYTDQDSIFNVTIQIPVKSIQYSPQKTKSSSQLSF